MRIVKNTGPTIQPPDALALEALKKIYVHVYGEELQVFPFSDEELIADAALLQPFFDRARRAALDDAAQVCTTLIASKNKGRMAWAKGWRRMLPFSNQIGFAMLMEGRALTYAKALIFHLKAKR